MKRKVVLHWVLGGLFLLGAAASAAAGPATTAAIQVQFLPTMSTPSVWRFEVVNASVRTLDIVRLTVFFFAGGHRLWGEPVVPTPTSVLQPGEAAWASVDVSRIPKQSPLRIDWELTWNPYSVPVLPRFLRTERAASLVIAPPASPPGALGAYGPTVPLYLPLETP